MKRLPNAFFLSTDSGPRFCLHHAAEGLVRRGCVLHLHAFAEELNTTRAMCARQSRLLAGAGFDVLQIDLWGCGDSAGDWADATWSQWLDDAELAAHWLLGRNSGPLWLWGVRAGALLVGNLLERLAAPANVLFWQPSGNGTQVLNAFLRLQQAGMWLARGTPDATRQPARSVLDEGLNVSVAGYTLTPALASGLDAQRLTPNTRGAGRRLIWLEVSPHADLSHAGAQAAQQWQAQGWQTHAEAIQGPAFWANTGAPLVNHLLETTTRQLQAGHSTP